MGDAALNDLSELAASVGVADLSSRSRVLVAGPDAAKLLNNLCTNDVVKLPEGGACEAFFLNAKGGVLFYARLLKGPEGIELDLEPGLAPAIIKHIDRYIIREKATLQDNSESSARLHVCGGAAEAVVRRTVDVAGPLAQKLVVNRVDRTPFPGLDIDVLGDDVAKEQFLTLLVEGAGRLAALSRDDMERLRVLAGLPAFGREIVEGCLAQEIDRNAQAISFTKGCYLGQETVARLDALGHVNKVLRGFTLDGAERPADGAKVRFNDKEVGAVSSSAAALDGRSVKCLGIVRTVAATVGTQVLIDFADGPRPATVSKLPFAEPRSHGLA